MKVWHRAAAQSLRALIVALVAALAAAGAVLVGPAGPAGAVATAAPTFEPDPASKGSIGFYDASGHQITGGSITDSPLAAYYAPTGGALHAGDTLAFVSYATPQDGVPTLSWTSNEQWTSSQTFGAGVTYPGSLAGSANAIVKGAATDGGLDVHIAAFANASAANPGIYQVRLYTSGTDVTSYYSSDILVSGTTWTQVYPVVSTAVPTSTALAALPVGHQLPGGTVDLTATVSPVAAGTVQFKDGAANLGAPVAVAAGSATLSVTTLNAGAHSITATFTPTDPSAFSASTSAGVNYLVGAVPAAPATVSAVPGGGSATVSWSAPANGGLPITGYDVRYSTDGANWTPASAAFHTSTATTQPVTGLTNGVGYVFEVAAINALGTGAYSAPSAVVVPAADPSIVVRGASAAINYGASATVSARLLDAKTSAPIAGAPLVLQARTNPAGAFVAVKAVTTSAVGAVAVSLRPRVNTQYRWVYAGTVQHAAATSGVVSVTVAQVVSIRSTRTRVTHGTPVKMWGAVTPTATGTWVSLQVRVGTGWRTIAKTRIVKQKLPNGRIGVGYVFTITPRHAGRLDLRVYRPATATNTAGRSATLGIRVL